MTGIEYPEPRSRARFLADNGLQPHRPPRPRLWTRLVRAWQAAMTSWRGGEG